MSAYTPVLQTFAPEFTDAARAALEQLLDEVHGVRSAVVSTSDGFELAVATRAAVSGERVAALSSSMLALAQASLRELSLSGSGTVLVECAGGRLLIAEAASGPCPTVLCVVAGSDTISGKLLWAARRCVQSVEQASETLLSATVPYPASYGT